MSNDYRVGDEMKQIRQTLQKIAAELTRLNDRAEYGQRSKENHE